MPSAKFIFPPNFEALAKATPFTVQLAISHLQTGWFTNSQETFMSAPVEVNSSGDVIGHSHIVIEKLSGFGQTTPTDPKSFTFFKALNDPAVNGVLSTVVTNGLPAGYYRIAAFHSGGNHQPSECDNDLAPPPAQGLTDGRSRISSRSSCGYARGHGRYGLCKCMAPRLQRHVVSPSRSIAVLGYLDHDESNFHWTFLFTNLYNIRNFLQNSAFEA